MPNLQQTANEAMAALQSGRSQVARDKFQQLIDARVNNATIWLGLAFACGHLKDSNTALHAVNQALRLEPSNLGALLFKADHYWHLGNNNTAADFYSTLLSLTAQMDKIPGDIADQLERVQSNYAQVEAQQSNFLENEFKEIQQQLSELGRDPGHRVQQGLEISLGKKQVYQQQPSKFHFPELPTIQFFEPQQFDWVHSLESQTSIIKHELLSALSADIAFEPYLQLNDEIPTLNKGGNWGSQDWGALYLWRSGIAVEETLALFPKTRAIFESLATANIGGVSPNILFSRLKPNTKIPPHHGFLNTRAICHLPLIVPEDCGALRVGNDTRAWQEGKVMVFDDSIEHEAWNNSSEDRIVLIFEIWRPEINPNERQAIAKILQSINQYKNQL